MEREFNSDDSGRNTPREVVVTRSDTPGPTPAYIYSRVSCLFQWKGGELFWPINRKMTEFP